jgi:outer membrane autotransporter protein
MVKRWMVAGTMAVSAMLSAAPAQSQGLGQAISNALSNNCLVLGNPAGGVANNPFFGPQLNNLCNPPAGGGGGGAGATGGASASTGSFSVENRLTGTDEERRILQRLKERRDEERKGGPAGASADLPGALRGLSVFVAGDFQSFDKEATSFEPGYDRETWGGTVGVDYALTGLGILGVAFTYNHATGWFDIGGGGFNIDTYGPTLYGTLFPMKNLFLDGYIGYSWKDYDSDRRINLNIPQLAGGAVVATGAALGKTDGDEFKAGANLGYDFLIRNLTIGPRVGVNYRETTINGFTERGATGTELVFLRQHHTSLTSVLGLYSSLAISTGVGVVIPQVTGEYLHEFENDHKSFGFRFAQDARGVVLRYKLDPPDRDYFNVGAGVALVLPNGLAPFANFRELLGYKHQTNHTVTAGVRFAF